jgi:hypothetical protein
MTFISQFFNSDEQQMIAMLESISDIETCSNLVGVMEMHNNMSYRIRIMTCHVFATLYPILNNSTVNKMIIQLNHLIMIVDSFPDDKEFLYQTMGLFGKFLTKNTIIAINLSTICRDIKQNPPYAPIMLDSLSKLYCASALRFYKVVPNIIGLLRDGHHIDIICELISRVSILDRVVKHQFMAAIPYLQYKDGDDFIKTTYALTSLIDGGPYDEKIAQSFSKICALGLKHCNTIEYCDAFIYLITTIYYQSQKSVQLSMCNAIIEEIQYDTLVIDGVESLFTQLPDCDFLDPAHAFFEHVLSSKFIQCSIIQHSKLLDHDIVRYMFLIYL